MSILKFRLYCATSAKMNVGGAIFAFYFWILLRYSAALLPVFNDYQHHQSIKSSYDVATGKRHSETGSGSSETANRRIAGSPALSTGEEAELVTMLSETQFHVSDVGDTVRLECAFRSEAYNLFDYPVIWRKQQLYEWTQINVMGSLNRPFVSTDRFEVTFSSLQPRYVFELTISEVARQDSGNYTCDIRGPQSVLLAQVTHHLFVRVPVDRVYILGVNPNDPTLPMGMSTGRSTTAASTGVTATGINSVTPSLRVVEGHPARLRCVAVGGYPPPSVDLYVGRRDITAHLSFSNAATLLSSGQPGMRQIHFRSERSTDSFLPTADDDGSPLRCVVVVPGSGPVAETVRLDVNYPPKISCNSVGAHVGDRDVTLECLVRAKPVVTALFWIVDVNGTTQADGETNENRIVVTKERSDGVFQSQLVLRSVTIADFRAYTFVAENIIALSTKEAELHLKHRALTSISTTGSLANSGSSSMSSSLQHQQSSSAATRRGSSSTLAGGGSGSRSRNSSTVSGGKTRSTQPATGISSRSATNSASSASISTPINWNWRQSHDFSRTDDLVSFYLISIVSSLNCLFFSCVRWRTIC